MNVRVVSDGTGRGTKIFDENGIIVGFVKELDIKIVPETIVAEGKLVKYVRVGDTSEILLEDGVPKTEVLDVFIIEIEMKHKV